MPNALEQGVIRSRPVGPREGITRFFERILGDNREAREKAELITGALETATPVGAVTGGYDLGNALGMFGQNPSVGNALGAAAIGMTMGVPGRKGIRAFHASPHSFERFDASKIGTGEGSWMPMGIGQKGHGLYFADNEREMENYYDQFQRTHPGDTHRYEVNIDADPEEFADWDKLSEDMRAAVKDPKLVAEMRREGIPGVKYTPPGPEGRKNYVVFDDRLIKIARKYGLLPFAGLPMMAGDRDE